MKNLDELESELHFNKRELLETVGYKEDFVEILLKTYCDGFANYYRNIVKALKESNEEALKSNAHGLKGSSLSVCMTRMAELANDIENSPIENRQKNNDLIEEIELEFQLIKELIS